ncbi:hypothetical protein GWK48_09230 [Metallosphaera tengchongensis]|uniref:Uncharacterized protein n=1 Tax=Metallosphaera tengchongensis TaxID=1532350 RepID=A0A6N0NUG9_9CREN|nr:hypothetical protein [Metallosphaera tengchongensis]QKR00534.1 hypothetical protein GWK48_09230 [Metallosphaera tengchongensis]
MRVVVPSISLFRFGEYTLGIAHYPLQTSGELLERVKNTMRLSSCSDKESCYPMIFGGIILFERGSPVWRLEYENYFEVTMEEHCRTSLSQFLDASSRGEETCLKGEGWSLFLRASKCANCKKVDPMGIRAIVT